MQMGKHSLRMKVKFAFRHLFADVRALYPRVLFLNLVKKILRNKLKFNTFDVIEEVKLISDSKNLMFQ